MFVHVRNGRSQHLRWCVSEEETRLCGFRRTKANLAKEVLQDIRAATRFVRATEPVVVAGWSRVVADLSYVVTRIVSNIPDRLSKERGLRLLNVRAKIALMWIRVEVVNEFLESLAEMIAELSADSTANDEGDE